MQQAPQQQTAMQQQFQIDFTIMQIKMNLLALAKDMAPIVNEDVRKLYLELREEVIGIPNPNNTKENGTEV